MILFSLISTPAASQGKLSPEELKALAAEMQKKAMSGKVTAAEMEAFKKRIGVAQQGMKAGGEKKKDPMQKVRLASLPSQVSGGTLTVFVTGMMKKLEAVLASDQRNLAKDILAKTDSVGQLSGWAAYFYQQGDVALATYLSGHSVMEEPENDLNTNNFSVLLIESGAPAHAVPVMRGLVQRYPETALFLNNLGQAFAGCGLRDSAMIYLKKCLADEPRFPAANKAAAQISKATGKKSEAIKYAQQSIESGMDKQSLQLLDELDPEGDHFSGFFRNKNIPDYFDMYTLKKPPHQRRPEEYEQCMAGRLAFKAEVERYSSELSKLYNEEMKLGEQQLKKDMKRFQDFVFTTGKLPGSMPVSGQMALAARIYAAKYIQYELPGKLRKLKDDYDAAIASELKSYDHDLANISSVYAEKKRPYNCGEGHGDDCRTLELLTKQECAELNKRLALYLEACANAADNFDTKQKQYAAELFYHKSKWGYRMGINEHIANGYYYAAAVEYLKNIALLAGYPPKDPHCVLLEKNLEKYTFGEIMKPFCPVNIILDFKVVSAKINCKEAVITVDPGKLDLFKAIKDYKFQYKENYASNSSTYSLVKVFFSKQLEGPAVVGKMIRLNAGAKVEITGTVFITIDGKGGDYGAKTNGTVSAWVEDPGNVMATKLHAEMGYEIGWSANSGWDASAKGLTGVF